TLLICTPSLHFFNILFGARQTFMQVIALVLTAITTTAVLMVSLAPITLFFQLTSSQYEFFKLLNVVFFAVAGVMGVLFLRHGISVVTANDDQAGLQTRRIFFALWVLLYGFVGSQMAWTLSPFIGTPGEPFVMISQMGGNFYTDVINSLLTLIR
ncbi:MAG: actin-binding WH2 domain-containing protein, partial [Chloroflexi bacterium]|nr:actin-binding WH2 domain-containing protein [Chloroflexota bacterium]